MARAASRRVKKKAEEEGRTIVFVDESAFYLLPMAVRTYAPVGQTPILTVRLTRDHLSAIGGLTPDGRLFMRFQDHLLKKLCRENFALIRENWQDLTTSFVRARQSRLDPTHGITTIMP